MLLRCLKTPGFPKASFWLVSNGSFQEINKNNQVINCPAFGIDTIDKVGTGDAMLALLSICFFSKIDEYVSLLLASLVAAQSIKTIGNRVPINKSELLKTLSHLMK